MNSRDSIPIGSLLLTPAIAAIDRVNDALTESGFADIRPAHARALRYIDDRGARITEMAESAHMTKQSMSNLVAYLVANDYLDFEPDPEDQRAKRVVLTSKGKKVQELASQTMKTVEADWSQAIGEDQMQALRTLLELLFANVKPAREDL